MSSFMDNRLLIFLETLESSNSVSEAAQKLYLTQPYISRVIKKYEQKYNVLILKRDSHPIQLTPAGHLLITYLRKSSQLENQLNQEMKKFKKSSFPTLKMGITPPLGENFNLAILPELFEKYPNLKTETLELSTADAEKAFKDEQIDLFVGNTIRLHNVENQSLHTDTQVLVLGKNSKLFKKNQQEIILSPTDFQTLNHENYITVDGERRYQEIINNYFSNIGIHFYPHIHVRDSLTALKLAAQGLGNMTTSIEAVKDGKYQNINYIKLPVEEVSINFSVSTLKSSVQLSSEIADVVNLLKHKFRTKILSV